MNDPKYAVGDVLMKGATVVVIDAVTVNETRGPILYAIEIATAASTKVGAQ